MACNYYKGSFNGHLMASNWYKGSFNGHLMASNYSIKEVCLKLREV